MAPNKDWKKIVADAASMTKEELASEVSSLTSLNDQELIDLIDKTTLSQQELAQILAVVHDATLSNEKKAEAISNIRGGIAAVLSIAEKLR